MTAISAIISNHCIAISSDSLLTIYNPSKRTNEIIESKKQKIVRVEKFLGAFSYWGLAANSRNGEKTMYKWLKKISNESKDFTTFEDFAYYVKDELKKEIASYGIAKKHTGIGIHLVGYENYEGYKIPELFLISNFTDPTYLKVGELGLSRCLFDNIPEEYKKNQSSITKIERQLLVKKFLNEGNMFVFNNGDPKMFTPLFEGYKNAMNLSKQRKALRDANNIEIYRNIARRPIEMIIKVQKDFYKEGKSIVGGRLHDLVIEKNNGNYSSTSGV